MRALTSLACAVVAWASSAAATDAPADAAWGRDEHERLAVTMLRHLGTEPQRDCPVEPALIAHFGTPWCGYVALAPNPRGERLVAWFVPDLPR